uniref:Solute carrier family 43 member 3a n=1 Tax=Oryzias latipes TaxID=8090 RepID=A0A3P9HX34_ORYLA
PFGCVVGSKLRFWLTLVSGMLECLCFAGVVFGFASLVFVLKEDGFFSELCISNLEINQQTAVDNCTSQDEQFSLVFTIASFLNNFLSLVNGFLFDRFGTFMTRLLAIFVYTTGTLLVAFSTEFSLMLFPALSCIGVGGMLLLITNMQVGNLFPAHRSTIITIYNGAFDSSSAVFLLIKVLHEQGVSLRSSFLFLSICSIIHLMRTVLLMPKTHIPHPLPDSYTYGVSCGRANAYDVEQIDDRREVMRFVSICSVRSFQSCVLSWFFLWHLAWLSIMQLRLYLFIGTLNPTLERLANNDPGLVSRYTNAFAMTQLCGVLCAPWNGFLLDRHKGKPRAAGETEQEADLRSSCLSLFLTSLQSLVFSMCVSIPVLPLQYLTFILQVLNRSFLYGGNAAFISIAFPACHFGKLYGLMMSLSAVFSLLQYPCFSLVKGPLGGDPFYVDVSLTLLTLLAFIHPAYIFVHSRNRARKRKKNFQPTGQKEA